MTTLAAAAASSKEESVSLQGERSVSPLVSPRVLSHKRACFPRNVTPGVRVMQSGVLTPDVVANLSQGYTMHNLGGSPHTAAVLAIKEEKAGCGRRQPPREWIEKSAASFYTADEGKLSLDLGMLGDVQTTLEEAVNRRIRIARHDQMNHDGSAEYPSPLNAVVSVESSLNSAPLNATDVSHLSFVRSSTDYSAEDLESLAQSVVLLANKILEVSQTSTLDVQTEEIESAANFHSRTTCGLMLKYNMIDNMVLGGPAFNTRQLSKGDLILKIDGFACTSKEEIHNLLLGEDIPGTTVTLTVKHNHHDSADRWMYWDDDVDVLLDGVIRDVTLIRMANEEIVDRRRIFELFTSLKDHALQRHDHDTGYIVDETISLWTKMVHADLRHDEQIEQNVKNLQGLLNSLLKDLLMELHHLHRMSRLHLHLASNKPLQNQIGIQVQVYFGVSTVNTHKA